MTRRLVLTWLVCGATAGLAQTDAFTDAADALDVRDYVRCIALVENLEKQEGFSPRLESIRAMALHELSRPADTFCSLERYAELTRGNASLQENPSHRELLQLLEQYRQKLAAEKKEKEKKLKETRDAEAAKILAAARTAAEQKQTAVRKRFDRKLAALAPRQRTQLSVDDYTLLKAAGSTAFSAQIDERVFGIPKLDTGVYRLGTSRQQFKAIVNRRLQETLPKADEALRAIIARFRLPGDERVHLGVAFPVSAAGTPSLLTTGSELESFAWSQPEFRLAQHQQPLLGYVAAMGDAAAPALAALGPGGSAPALAQVGFDVDQRVSDLVFVLPLPTQTDSSAVIKRLIERFGRLEPLPGADADGVVRYQPARDFVQGGRFAFPAVAGVRLTGRVVHSPEVRLKTPVFLELRFTRVTPETADAGIGAWDAVDVQPGRRWSHSRRLALIGINTAQQSADGLLWNHGGKPWRLAIGAQTFTFFRDIAEQRFGLIDLVTGARHEITYSGISLDGLIEISRPHVTERDGPKTVLVRLARPARLRSDVADPGESNAVPFFGGLTASEYSADVERPLRRAALCMLPRADGLSVDGINQLLALHGASAGDEVDTLIELVRAAEGQGKTVEPLLAAVLYAESDPAIQLTYLRRSAEAGNPVGMRKVVEHHERFRASQSRLTLSAPEVRTWIRRGAEAGDAYCTQRFIEQVIVEDYITAERWLKQLHQRGIAYEPPLSAEDLAARAQQVRQYQAMNHDQRLRSYRPMGLPDVIGKAFKDYAKGWNFAKHQEYKSPETGRKVTIYRMMDAHKNQPTFVWVGRRGVVVGAQYFLGRPSSYGERLGELRQLFGSSQLIRPVYSQNVPAEAVAVSANTIKSIELLRYEKESYLKVIDHTRE